MQDSNRKFNTAMINQVVDEHECVDIRIRAHVDVYFQSKGNQLTFHSGDIPARSQIDHRSYQ